MKLWSALQLDPARCRVLTLVGGGGKTTSMYALAREARALGKTVVVTTTTHMMPHPSLFLTDGTDTALLRADLERYGVVTVGRLDRRDKMTGGDVAACRAAADLVLVEGDGARLHPLKVPAEHEPVIPPESDAVVAVAGMDCLGGTLSAVCHRSGLVAALLDKPPDAEITPADVARILLSPLGGRKNVGGDMAFRCILNKADDPRRRALAGGIAALLAARHVPAAITSYTEEEQGGDWFTAHEASFGGSIFPRTDQRIP